MPRQISVARQIRIVRTAFIQLARSFGRLGQALQGAAASANNRPVPSREKPVRRRPRLSPAQRRALVLQGRYMGTLRGLKPRQQAQVKKIRAAKGIRAAIAAARRMAG